ncbi:hypothetical protein [Mesorhizobium sp. WSM1293]|uniref:ORC-CDC6 family AAA ATPase n=1 Tax=Mesorhizobium sp. WSM1293 TaxID=1040984 RepID=UPI000488DBC7|nr:hypothetical protein [Mesorhizobium sp. WSM1293]
MQNPFGPNRIEYESRPILWFSQKSALISAAAKPVFVAGTRGSGKTSILRSLSTVHILEDKSLADQVGKLGWYGVFFQLNETFSPLIDNAVLNLIPEHIRFDTAAVIPRQFVIFSHYLELKIVERLLDSIGQLRRDGHLKYRASEDRDVALALHREVLHFIPQPARLDFFSIDELRGGVTRYVDECFNAFFFAADAGAAGFRATDPGAIINKVATAITPLLNGPSFAGDRAPFFKILIDDCEALTPLQQQFLNTLVRKTRGNVKWVLAYIGGLYDTIRTIIPGQSLSNADRDVENLDSVDPREFATLCENVSSLRLYYALPDHLRSDLKRNDALSAFSLKSRLGRLSVNDIIERVIISGHSEGREELVALADAAREFLSVNLRTVDQQQFLLDRKARPYAEGLALALMNPEIKRRPMSKADASNLKRSIARKQGWAFLKACQMLGLHDYPYVGHQIITSLSDVCIRDFLDIMGEIFRRSVPNSSDPRKLVEFINSDLQIHLEQQRQAVNAASQRKLDGLQALSHPYEEESVRMVRALGYLTARLQTEFAEENALGTTERGIFRVDLNEMRSLVNRLEQPSGKLDEVLRRAERDGFIREVSAAGNLEVDRADPASKEMMIRLHRRFAPYFGFSYRGPYEINTIPAARMVDLLFTRHRLPEDWADSVFKELVARPALKTEFQHSLFENDLE